MQGGAPTPEALMRSRYAAFALGNAPYLLRTQAPVADEDRFRRDVQAMREGCRFLGLTILHTETAESDGEVLFYARIFERGKDKSFAELSRFSRHGSAWRYENGDVLPAAGLPQDPAQMSHAEFLLRYERLTSALRTP